MYWSRNGAEKEYERMMAFIDCITCTKPKALLRASEIVDFNCTNKFEILNDYKLFNICDIKMGVRTTFGIGWWDPEALVKICFQNITLTNILVRLVN